MREAYSSISHMLHCDATPHSRVIFQTGAAEVVSASLQAHTHTLTKTCLNSAPTQSRSHQTNLAFFLSEEAFARLLLAWLLLGRSLKRLSLVCGNGMAEPNLLTTTSSLPPISTALTESRNYSPAQNLALSSPGSGKACECAVSPLHLLCVLRASDVVALC